MNIEAYDIDSLRKLVRSLQNENTVLKAQLQKANIPYEEYSHFEEKIEKSENYDLDQGERIIIPEYIVKRQAKMTYQNPTIIYGSTVEGRFIKRNNRFTAMVLIDNREETVHVKNTGRLRELLVKDARVILQKSDNPDRKTAYDLISVYKPGLKWVNIDSLAPNELMKQYLLDQGYDLVRPEYTYGDSRIDFYMERSGEKFLTEVKGCTLAVKLPPHDSAAQENRSLLNSMADRKPELFSSDAATCETQSAGYDQAERIVGLFPDAPTERGVKHLHELAKAAKEGYHCSIAFVIQMNGIHTVYPNDETQPEFGRALADAVKAGVHVVCYGCRVEADRISITGAVDDTGRYLEI